MFHISDQIIDVEAFKQGLTDHSCGANVVFEGWVRNHHEGREVLQLEYEVYTPVAVKEGQRILAEAIERFGIQQAAAIHRSGLLKLEGVAVVVGVSSHHRAEAFGACRYIIDQAKTRLPIWKKEYYADGEIAWVNCQGCADAATHQHKHSAHG